MDDHEEEEEEDDEDEEETVSFDGAVEAWNMDGSSDTQAESGSWLRDAEEATGRRRGRCSFDGCPNQAEVGGHVWIRGEGCFIAPICRPCNRHDNPERMQGAGACLRANIVVTKTAMTDMTTTIMLPKSPFLRTAGGNLSSPSRENLDTHLRSARTFSRRVLEVDLLTDPQEATFGITPANVAVHLEQRWQLLDVATQEIRASVTATGVNEQPLSALGLGSCDLWKGYIPLATLIVKRWQQHRASGCTGAFVVGINAPPGSGNSTLLQILQMLLHNATAQPPRIVQIGSDDLYMGASKREAHTISTRLDPRSLDPEFDGLIAQLKHASASDGPIMLPRFNKGTDDREARGIPVQGPFDIVLFEGWRVGVPSGELHGSNFDYTNLNAPIDFMIYVDAEPEHVWHWKLQSSRRDYEREHNLKWTNEHTRNLRQMWELWILPFLRQHEQPLRERADLVLFKDATHRLQKVELH